MAHRHPSVHTRSLAALVAGCLATVLVVGCNDPELERQAAFDRQFRQVSDEYAQMLRGRPDLLSVSPSDDAIAALRALGTRVKGLADGSDGSDGQRRAAREFAASVQRTSASIHLARATWLESSEEILRGLVLSASHLAADLEAIASAAEAMDVSATRSGTEQAKSEVSSLARRLKDELANLEGPASALNDEISQANARLAELGQEAAVLLRKARESSASAGFALVEEAAAIKTEARTLATTASMKQIEADEMAAEAIVVGGTLQVAERMQAAATSALEFINSYESSVDGEAAKAREVANGLRSTANGMLKSLSEERAGVLKTSYDTAAAELASASADTQSDALKNYILSDELRLRVTQLMGIGAHGRMLASIGGDAAKDLTDLRGVAEAAIADLKERASAASERFSSAGEDPALSGMKEYVDGIKKLADGLSVDRLMNPPKPPEAKVAKAPGASSGRSMSGGSVDANGSEADLEALVEKLNNASTTAESTRLMMELVDDSSGSGRAMKDIATKGAKMMAPLLTAVEEKFGADGVKALGSGMSGGMGGMGGGVLSGFGLSGLTKKSFDGNKAVYSSASGQDVQFVYTSNGWRIDLVAAVPPAQAAMMEQAGPMIDMVMKPIGDAMTALADRVRAGEFKSAEEVAAAIQQQMAEAMSGAMGGGFRGRGRGGRGGGDAGAEGEN